MRLKELKVEAGTPLSQWPIFYKDGLPFIYDDDELFFDERGNRLGEHRRHTNLAIYLQAVLLCLYQNQICTVSFEITFRAYISLAKSAAADAAGEVRRYVDITPDVALVKNVVQPDAATYVVGTDGPPPQVVFEVGSPRTFKQDLTRKLELYAEVVQAKEYIAYDPRAKRLWPGSRLKAWRLVEGRYVELIPDKRGWIWSEELESWLVEDDEYLRLYDEQANQRLTPTESEQHRADQEQSRADQEQSRADQAEAELQAEKIRGDKAQLQVQAEKIRADKAQLQAQQEKLRVEQLEVRLRELEAQLRKAEPDVQ